MHRLIALSVLAIVVTAAAPLHAQQYPTKPIRIIVPFPPGDSLDTMSRLIAPKLTERLGQNIVVDNRAGGAGQLGLELAAHAPRRRLHAGRRAGRQSGGAAAYLQETSLRPAEGFRAGRASRRRIFSRSWSIRRGRIKTLKDLIAYGRANPGKLSFASNGEGGFPHMAIEMLRAAGGLHIPARALQGQRADRHRDSRRPRRCDHPRHRRRWRRSSAPAALRLLAVTSPTRADAVSRRAGDGRNAARLRFARLVRLPRARRHAAEDRRAAQPRNQPCMMRPTSGKSSSHRPHRGRPNRPSRSRRRSRRDYDEVRQADPRRSACSRNDQSMHGATDHA